MMLDMCFCQHYPKVERTGENTLEEELESLEPKSIGFDNWTRNKIQLTKKQISSISAVPSPKQKIDRVLASKDFDLIDPSSFS